MIKKRKCLLTWYGITDLRASLELEKSGGPILGAIKTKQYTDVIILGYTDPTKQNPLDITNIEKNDFCNKFSNTNTAHEIYRKWLKNKIEDNRLETKFNLYKIPLKKLNDSKGIYKAVSKVIDIVTTKYKINDITFFLSPGTPLMAFVWALTSLVNQSLKIKVIASSDPLKPPELVSLPTQLMDSIRNTEIKHIDNNKDLDVIFHLFGEQRLPIIFAINHFNTKKHIFINSEEYPADIMLNFIKKENFEQICIKPFDPKSIENTILKKISSFPKNIKIGFNLTGGTKLMYAGALSASQKTNSVPFYFESKNNNLIYLNDYSRINVKKIENVETFIKLNTHGLKISKEGIIDKISDLYEKNRILLTNDIFNDNQSIRMLYYDLALNNLRDNPGKPFNIIKNKISATLNKDLNANITLNNKHYSFDKWPDFASYLNGGWLEEFAFHKLQKLEKNGLIKNLRLGMEISIKNTLTNGDWKQQLSQLRNRTYQEIDLCFTVNNSLYIVECKSGKVVKSNDINKLENIRRLYGGNNCKAILFTALPLTYDTTKKRLKDHPNIYHSHSKQFDIFIKNIISR